MGRNFAPGGQQFSTMQNTCLRRPPPPITRPSSEIMYSIVHRGCQVFTGSTLQAATIPREQKHGLRRLKKPDTLFTSTRGMESMVRPPDLKDGLSPAFLWMVLETPPAISSAPRPGSPVCRLFSTVFGFITEKMNGSMRATARILARIFYSLTTAHVPLIHFGYPA